MKENHILNKREIQLKELSILKRVVAFMENNNISYMLCGGTFLGAIRHAGFIPWDDDIDIMMARPEYEKFISLIKNDNVNFIDNLYLHAFELKNLDLPFAKVLDHDVQAEEIGYKDSYQRYLWIDIFPIDGLPDTDDENKKLFKKNKRLAKLLSIKKMNISSLSKNSIPKNILKIIFKIILLPISKRSIAHRIINNSKRYNYEKCVFAGRSAWGYGIKEKMKREIFEKITKTKFEDTKLAILKDYNLYLSSIYGDYMKLPPKSKRTTHSVKAWINEHEQN